MAPVKLGNIKGPPGTDAKLPDQPLGYTRGGGVLVQNQGTPLGGTGTLDFAGAGVTTAITGGNAVVTIPGGGGGGGVTMTISDTDPGAVGAGNLWLQTDPTGNNASYQLSVRAAANNQWLPAGIADRVGDPATQYFAVNDANSNYFAFVGAGVDSLGAATRVRLFAGNPSGSAYLTLYPDGLHMGNSAASPAILSGSSDPSAGAGVAEPVGSLYLRDDGAGNGELWLKTGAADAAWTKITTP